MQKIVIVDDEIGQCIGMEKIMGCLFRDVDVKSFTDVNAALEYIQAEQVKIIISDICMPDMDGLEFTGKIKAFDKTANVILLTGYAEFAYAQKAVRLGVFDYLLKPLDPEELQRVISEALQKVEKEKHNREQEKLVQKQLDKVVMEKILNNWIHGWSSEDEMQAVKDIIPGDESGFIAVTRFRGVLEQKNNMPKAAFEEWKNRIGLWMKAQIGNNYHSLSFFSNTTRGDLVTIVLSKHSDWGYPRCFKGEFFQEEYKDTGCDAFDIPSRFQIGISSFEEDLAFNIQRAYKKAFDVLEYGFYFENKKVLKSDDYILKEDSLQRELEKLENWIRTKLLEGNSGEVISHLQKVFAESFGQTYPKPKKFVTLVSEWINQIAMKCTYEKKFVYQLTGTEHSRYPDFVLKLSRYLQEFADNMQERKQDKGSLVEKEFRDYIRQHYMEDVSLEDIAERLMLTPSYCSALIKKLTGMTFSQSLIAERIDKAKELLQDTKLQVNQIADDIGYKDVKYFNRVFKNEVGMTPMQYRKETGRMQKR